MTHSRLIIAIDGPAASGKGTLARRLAVHFALPHLDTGLSYRAVAHALLQSGLPLDRADLASIVAENLDFSLLERNVLANHDIGEGASRVAAMREVRKVLVARQRRFAYQGRGAVLDGRDIGTVVCPDADVKLFVTASPQKRAQRRYDEAFKRGDAVSREQILTDIIRRDERDMGRADGPLKAAKDAHLIDTSEMSIEIAFGKVLALVEACLSER